MCEYGFAEGEDFNSVKNVRVQTEGEDYTRCSNLSESTGGRPTVRENLTTVKEKSII